MRSVRSGYLKEYSINQEWLSIKNTQVNQELLEQRILRLAKSGLSKEYSVKSRVACVNNTQWISQE